MEPIFEETKVLYEARDLLDPSMFLSKYEKPKKDVTSFAPFTTIKINPKGGISDTSTEYKFEVFKNPSQFIDFSKSKVVVQLTLTIATLPTTNVSWEPTPSYFRASDLHINDVRIDYTDRLSHILTVKKLYHYSRDHINTFMDLGGVYMDRYTNPASFVRADGLQDEQPRSYVDKIIQGVNAEAPKIYEFVYDLGFLVSDFFNSLGSDYLDFEKMEMNLYREQATGYNSYYFFKYNDQGVTFTITDIFIDLCTYRLSSFSHELAAIRGDEKKTAKVPFKKWYSEVSRPASTIYQKDIKRSSPLYLLGYIALTTPTNEATTQVFHTTSTEGEISKILVTASEDPTGDISQRSVDLAQFVGARSFLNYMNILNTDSTRIVSSAISAYQFYTVYPHYSVNLSRAVPRGPHQFYTLDVVPRNLRIEVTMGTAPAANYSLFLITCCEAFAVIGKSASDTQMLINP